MQEMLDEAIEAIRASSKESSVYIGCDSIRFKKDGIWYARYSTVVVLHIDSKKGARLFHHSETIPDYGAMKQRLLTEVAYAVTAALGVVEAAGDRYMEVHLDLNKSPKHKSYVAVQEALGYVRGSLPGVEAKIKPHSWAATHASDHAVRNKLVTAPQKAAA
jgi:predicted RNase H-related nuclease YkuK (DUF458 family)